MSKFSKYGIRVDQIAREAFSAYRKAENALKDAEAKRKEYPVRYGVVSTEYAAKAARAEADYQEARGAVETARRALTEKAREFSTIRKELSEAVGAEYAASPESIDSNALELLKSGIFDSTDMTRMYNKYVADGNYTMARLVSKYAGDAAEQRMNDGYHGNDKECQTLRYLSTLGNQHKGSSHVESFDALKEIYDRCIVNPILMDSWEDFTAPIIESL